jgi:hypothetical protein
MKTSEALKLIGGLSKPSKMPGWSYGLPAKECKTGSKLRLVPGSTCYNCYALKGCYVFKVVQDAQYKRLAATKHPLWVGWMQTVINSKKSKYFRWHDSGDVQDEGHLMKIFAVCRLTPSVKHWLPTREAWVKHFLPMCPKNLVIRFSAPMIDTPAPGTWPNTSTVVTAGASCPAPLQDGKCNDCRKCWNKRIKNVSYGKH